jgi:hypothetical protein
VDVAARLVAGVQPGPIPTDPAELVTYAGGARALTQQLSGLDHTPRRAEYAGTTRGQERFEADRRAWRSAARRVQRLPGRQSVGAMSTAQRRRTIAGARDQRKRQAARRGMRVRMVGMVSIVSAGKPTDERARTMPAAATPGVLIPADIVERALQSEDSAELLAYFFSDANGAYNIGDLDPEVEFSSVHFWEDGEPEHP